MVTTEIKLDKDHVLVPIEYRGWHIVRRDLRELDRLLKGEFASAQEGKEHFQKYLRGKLHRDSLGRYLPLTPKG
jgi:hypothetical protein